MTPQTAAAWKANMNNNRAYFQDTGQNTRWLCALVFCPVSRRLWKNRRNRVAQDAARGAGNSGHWKGIPTLSNDRHNAPRPGRVFLQQPYNSLSKHAILNVFDKELTRSCKGIDKETVIRSSKSLIRNRFIPIK